MTLPQKVLLYIVMRVELQVWQSRCNPVLHCQNSEVHVNYRDTSLRVHVNYRDTSLRVHVNYRDTSLHVLKSA